MRGPTSVRRAQCIASSTLRTRSKSGAIRSVARTRRARAPGHPPERRVELGYHQTAWPATWTYFYLYVILDIFSRYVVGWMIAPRESAVLAERLIADTCAKHGIHPGQLTLHADRGTR